MQLRQGFSLLEMVLVLGLLMIMTTIGVSAWNRYTTNTNFREAARAIEADIKYMKQNALSQEFTTVSTPMPVNYGIVFYRTAGNYTLQALDSTNNTLFTRTKQLSSFGQGHIAFVSFPNGGSNYTLNFLSRGILGGLGTIVINNSLNSSANIVFTQSGKIYVDFHMQ